MCGLHDTCSKSSCLGCKLSRALAVHTALFNPKAATLMQKYTGSLNSEASGDDKIEVLHGGDVLEL